MLSEDTLVLNWLKIISRRQERVSFDLVLPDEVMAVTGIIAEAVPSSVIWNKWQATGWSESEAGQLSLRWPLPGDIFFQTKVDAVQSYDFDHVPLGLLPPEGTGFLSGQMTRDLKQIQPAQIQIPGHLRIIEAYYKDQMNEAIAQDTPYPLLLTLYCQTR